MSRGGVNDNADLRKTVGYADFSNLAPTLTEAVGNEPLETTAKTLSGGINELKKSVSDGKAKVANAITAQGVSTATDATFQTMADNIATLAGNLSSASADSYNKGYAQGVTDADNRANVNSVNYKAGYSAGINSVSLQTTAISYNGGTGVKTNTYTWNLPLDAGTYILTCVGISNQNGGYATEPSISLDGHNQFGAVLLMNDVKSQGDLSYGSINVKTQTYKISGNGGTLSISITAYNGQWTGNAHCATYQLTKISNTIT